jgi:hypothetical protein
MWQVTDTTMIDSFIWNLFDTCKFDHLDVASNIEGIPKYQMRLDQKGYVIESDFMPQQEINFKLYNENTKVVLMKSLYRSSNSHEQIYE